MLIKTRDNRTIILTTRTEQQIIDSIREGNIMLRHLINYGLATEDNYRNHINKGSIFISITDTDKPTRKF